MAAESKVTKQADETADATLQPRKQWETPRFEQHDVRTTTQAKGFNALETSLNFTGPMS